MQELDYKIIWNNVFYHLKLKTLFYLKETGGCGGCIFFKKDILNCPRKGKGPLLCILLVETGSLSEKSSFIGIPNQLALFEEIEITDLYKTNKQTKTC